jgi:putative Holliday junction resolvase
MTGDAPVRRGRVVGIDLGSRRIGIAVSDSAGTMALPRATVVRSGDASRDRQRLVDLVLDEEAVTVVVGLPLSLDGSKGTAATAAAEEADALGALLAPHQIDVELFDERLTTVSAHQALTAGGADGRQRRRVVDQAAAAVLLEAWLDGRRPRP